MQHSIKLQADAGTDSHQIANAKQATDRKTGRRMQMARHSGTQGKSSQSPGLPFH